MPCDTIKRETREEAIKNAAAALKSGKARLAKRAGKLTLDGLTAADRAGMNDSCLLAGIAKTADLLTRAKIHAAGTTPDALITAHGHTHGGHFHTH